MYLAAAVASLRPVDAPKTRLAITLVNYTPALKRATYPVLGVVGEDSWRRSMTYMEELRQVIPRTQLKRIADSTDPNPLCQVDTINEVLRDFLDADDLEI